MPSRGWITPLPLRGRGCFAWSSLVFVSVVSLRASSTLKRGSARRRGGREKAQNKVLSRVECGGRPQDKPTSTSTQQGARWMGNPCFGQKITYVFAEGPFNIIVPHELIVWRSRKDWSDIFSWGFEGRSAPFHVRISPYQKNQQRDFWIFPPPKQIQRWNFQRSCRDSSFITLWGSSD